MASFTVEIYTPEQNLYLGRAEALTARAVDGDLQILPGHAPYMNILAAGEIRLNTEENTCLHFKHGGGLLEFARGKATALVID